jgi:hypothetical protein
MTPYFTPPHTPKASFASFGSQQHLVLPPHGQQQQGGQQGFSEPPTARPGFDDQPPTTEDAFPAFTVSTILPNFLYLGPELTTAEHVAELRDLGVKRIVNIAVECDDDHGLGLREVFDKYLHIPMRDTVEEDNITRGVREVCDFLGELRFYSWTSFSLPALLFIHGFLLRFCSFRPFDPFFYQRVHFINAFPLPLR